MKCHFFFFWPTFRVSKTESWEASTSWRSHTMQGNQCLVKEKCFTVIFLNSWSLWIALDQSVCYIPLLFTVVFPLAGLANSSVTLHDSILQCYQTSLVLNHGYIFRKFNFWGTVVLQLIQIGNHLTISKVHVQCKTMVGKAKEKEFAIPSVLYEAD